MFIPNNKPVIDHQNNKRLEHGDNYFKNDCFLGNCSLAYKNFNLSFPHNAYNITLMYVTLNYSQKVLRNSASNIIK